MVTTQIFEILNTVVNGMTGISDITVTNTAGIISLGQEVLSSDTNKDDFLNVLTDRIGRTIISQRAYNAPDKTLVYNSFEFGAILQKIYVDPPVAVKSETWGLQDGISTASFVIAKPTVKQNLFSNRDSWQINVTIPDVQLETAFLGEEEMSVFISAIWTAEQNAMALQLEALTNIAYSNFIAEKLVNKAQNPTSIRVVNLLTDYNTAHGTTLTPAQALENLDFLKYSATVIDKYSNRMERMSTLFNDAGRKRHTPKELQRITLLDSFSFALDNYLQADTFHDEYTKLPYYTTVPYWQGSGETYSFAETSFVNIQTGTSNKIVEQTGIVGLITDYEAIGVMINKERKKAQYLPNEEVTTYFHKFDKGMFNDMSENGVVFVIAEELNAPTDPVQA